MNLKKSIGHKFRDRNSQADLNITSFMNVFLIMIPFLLLTASFVRIAVLDLSLPNLEKKSSAAQTQKPEKVILNFLFIRESGFEVKSPELNFNPLTKSGADYDWTSLRVQLKIVKEKYPNSEEIIIAPENTIKYETIIQVMDHCRESGFPTISISG